jgi:hypothetical protein
MVRSAACLAVLALVAAPAFTSESGQPVDCTTLGAICVVRP